MSSKKSVQGLYRYVLEMMSDGLIIQNEDGMMTYVNERLRSILGYAEEEMLGNVLSDFLMPDEHQVYWREMADIKKDIVHPFELRICNKSGHILYMLVSPRAIIDPEGRFRGSFAVFNNISVQKKRDIKYREIKRLEALASFSAGMGHEFNNQLMKIRNYVALAKSRLTDQKALLRLGKAEFATEKARELVRKLISFSSQNRAVAQRCDIRDLISDTVMLGFAESCSRFEITVAEDCLFVLADGGFVCQALYQLFENSFEAMPEEGLIKLHVANEVVDAETKMDLPSGHYVKIVVRDDGRGLDFSAEHGHLFEPYYSTKGKERGFGLFLAKWLLEAAGGTIILASDYSAFEIYLPAEELTLTKTTVSSTETVPLPETSATMTKDISETMTKEVDTDCQIIVMDDDWEIRDVVGMMLYSMGYKFKLVENGEMLLQELSAYATKKLPAVILDLTIKEGMGGVETMQKIKALYADIKVFVSSGHLTHPLVLDFAKHGFCGAISKPYDYDELEAILQKHLLS